MADLAEASADIPVSRHDGKLYFDIATDPQLMANMIGFRQAANCEIVMLYEMPKAGAMYVKAFDLNGPSDDRLTLPSQKTWVLVSMRK